MYNPQYAEIPISQEQAQKILITQFTKEEADLLLFLAKAYKEAQDKALVEAEEQVNEYLHRQGN